MKHAREDYNRFQDPALNDSSLLGEGSTPFAEDEPVFLLRAQDCHAAMAVKQYADLLADDPDVDPKMVKVCKEWASIMASWPTKKSPDMSGENGSKSKGHSV